MERIRERFSTNTPSRPPPPSRIPPTPPTPPSSVRLPPARPQSSTIVLQLTGPDHLLYEPTGVVEFYRPSEGLSCTLSSSRYIAHKVVALQGIYELLERENRSDLDPLRESPIVHAILSSFRSKKECLDEIHWRAVDLEMRTVLSGWANDVWVDGEEKQGKQRGSDGESSDGSLFSEDDGGNSEGGRVRPITLRPRRTLNTPAPPRPSKSSTSRTPTSIRPAHLSTTQGAPCSMAPQMVTTKTTRETSPIQNLIRVAPLTGSHETMPNRVKDERVRTQARRIIPSNSLACPPRSKLVRMGPSFSSSYKEASQVATKKRALPAPSPFSETAAPKRYKVSPGVVSSPTKPQSSRPRASHTTILESLSQTLSTQARPTEPTETERYVVKYWGEVQTRLSPEFRTSSTTEQLAHYFRQMEHLKQELDILKKDEKARRRQMVLIGEKIKLMNQPVARDPQ